MFFSVTNPFKVTFNYAKRFLKKLGKILHKKWRVQEILCVLT